MTRRGGGRAAAIALAAAVALAAPRSQANGAFPASGQVIVDPTDPSVVFVSATFGLAKSSDAGAAFHLVCEEAIGFSSGFHPFYAMTPRGAIFGGLPDGLASAQSDTCTFTRAPELEGLYVVDVSVGPSGRAIAVALPPAPADALVFVSDDDLATWTQLGAPLPEKTTPLTIDVAPSDPSRIYVSAMAEGDPPFGILVRSIDGGQTWSSVFVPESEASTQPFLAAVDPENENRLYVRLNGAPGRLFVSDDGGVMFTQVLQTQGFLRAFDLSADGSFALLGGDLDGLFRLDTETLTAEPHATIAARCVNIEGARVFACGTPAVDGFSAGVSTDGGVTFEPLFVQTCLKGPLPCAAGTPVGDLCPAAWPSVEELLGVTGCEGGGGGASAAASGTSGTGPAASSSGAGTGGAGADGLDPSGGCRCSTPERESDARWLVWLGLAALGRRGTRRG